MDRSIMNHPFFVLSYLFLLLSSTYSFVCHKGPANIPLRLQASPKKRDFPKIAVDTYLSYLQRLWKETDPLERRMKLKGSSSKRAIRNVMDMIVVDNDDDDDINDHEDLGSSPTKVRNKEYQEAKQMLWNGCQKMLEVLEVEEKVLEGIVDDNSKDLNSDVTSASVIQNMSDHGRVEMNSDTSKAIAVNGSETMQVQEKKPKKKTRSVMFGALMGAVVAGWVFSGNYIFTGLFASMTVLGQLEYYRMVMNTGTYPARRISCLGAAAMFVTALVAPNLHQICLPVFATWSMIWFLTMRRKISTISDISTTLTGMTYLGYIPSFWVRIRLIGGGREPTKLAPLVAPMLDFFGKTANSLPSFIPKYIHLPITTGAIFIFWTWLCIAFSDVGAYFTGINFGKTKLGEISPAAGVTSPNKTIEGVVGGCLTSAALATLGAWVQNWPYWWLTGPIHGIMLGFLGLIGDLTASMLKRDAGLKDFGDLLPEHGGIMDRVDSFIFTAPYSWLVLSYILPSLKYGKKFIFNTSV